MLNSCKFCELAYLDGENDDSSVRDHVEEKGHGLVLVRRVRVKGALGHDTARRLVQH